MQESFNTANSPNEQSEAERAGRSQCSTGSRIFFAIFLIVAGILLFLSNIGLIPIRNVWDYWPVILIIVGIGKLGSSRRGSRPGGILLIVFGGLFLCSTLQLFHVRNDGTWLISLLFLGAGIFTLMTVLDPSYRSGPWRNRARIRASELRNRARLSFDPEVSVDNVIQDNAVFGSVKRRVEAPNFQGGEVDCVLGSVELDLRLAQIPQGALPVTLQVNAVFGSVKFRIPSNWKVTMSVVGVFGNAEDKTLPQTREDPGAPLLVVVGQSVFATVEVES